MPKVTLCPHVSNHPRDNVPIASHTKVNPKSSFSNHDWPLANNDSQHHQHPGCKRPQMGKWTVAISIFFFFFFFFLWLPTMVKLPEVHHVSWLNLQKSPHVGWWKHDKSLSQSMVGSTMWPKKRVLWSWRSFQGCCWRRLVLREIDSQMDGQSLRADL